jgi:hypothetical protein
LVQVLEKCFKQFAERIQTLAVGMENWMRKYAEKRSLAVFDSKVRVIFMILDHLIEN